MIVYDQVPEGVVLDDWTPKMKQIFETYLGGVVPPFFWAEGLRVSYDNLGILQARGTSRTGIVSDYVDTLNNNGYMAYEYAEEKCTRLAGRGIGQGFLVSIDGLDQNGMFSVNYDIDFAESDWPAEYLAMVLADEMYGYTKTVIPPYEYANAQYYFAMDGFGGASVLCLGASAGSVDAYSKILTDNSWSVTAMTGEYEGCYTAISRDKLVVLVYYFDGTGLQIIVGFGEGESYATWDECLAAIDDFGAKELRYQGNISDNILPIPEAELYEIDRDIRGCLKITAYKSHSFTEQDRFQYIMDMFGTGKYEYAVKGDYYWLTAKDKSHAILLDLEDYVSDTLEVTTFCFYLYDYRIYEGAIVYYGEWPTLMVDTIRNAIQRGLAVPGYHNEDATYYAFSDRAGPSIRIEIVNPGDGALALYRDCLTEEYGWTVITNGVDSFEAIDRDEVAMISGAMVNGEFVITLGRYYKSDIVGNRAKFDFTNKNQLLPGGATSDSTRTWSNGEFSVTVNKGTSTYPVGNYDYLANPLRLYKNQTVTITATNHDMTKLEFYVTAKDGSTHNSIKNFDVNFLRNVTMEGATFASFNSETGMMRFTVDSSTKTVTFTVTTTSSQSNSGFGLSALDVFFAD